MQSVYVLRSPQLVLLRSGFLLTSALVAHFKA
jgi:hypothetical protein